MIAFLGTIAVQIRLCLQALLYNVTTQLSCTLVIKSDNVLHRISLPLFETQRLIKEDLCFVTLTL